MFRSLIIVTVLLSAMQGNLFSQSCAVKLRNAENEFNAGRVEDVPGLLAECLVSGFTRAEELNAYQLIIRSYLFDDETEKAEETMLEFLKKNPEYKLSPTDNADFVYLFNKYRVKPQVQIAITGTANLSLISVVEQNSISGAPVNGKYRNDASTYGVGIEARFKLSELMEIGGGADYSQVGFSYTETFLDFTTINYSEKQLRLEVPIQLYFTPLVYGRFYPYGKVGTGLALNFNTEAVVYTENIDVNNAVPHTGEPEKRNAARGFADPFITAGLGCKVKLPRSYIFLDISGRIGITNQTITEIPSNLEYYYYYTDDIFRTNTLRFSLGYIYIFYKPERLKD